MTFAPVSPTCLVVEDEPLIARALARQLASAGITATIVATLEGVRKLEGPFDCAVIDLDLPDGCGIEAPDLLPEGSLRSTPVFFSATDSTSVRDQARARGVLVSKAAGTREALRALAVQLTRAQRAGSGTFLRPTAAESEFYDANLARVTLGRVNER